jgi:hypothetical protein
MNQLWPFSTGAMLLSLPLVFGLLLFFIHLVVEFGPRALREHRVAYRPIQTRIADLMLIVRLVFSKR